MTDRGDQPGGVVVVEADDGVVEADWGAFGKAGGELEDAAFAAGAWEAARGEGGDGGLPVDGCHGDTADSAVLDEPGGEVISAQERAVADEEGDASLNRVDPGGAGAEGGGEVVSVH